MGAMVAWVEVVASVFVPFRDLLGAGGAGVAAGRPAGSFFEGGDRFMGGRGEGANLMGVRREVACWGTFCENIGI